MTVLTIINLERNILQKLKKKSAWKSLMKKLTFSIHVGPKQNSPTVFCAWCCWVNTNRLALFVPTVVLCCVDSNKAAVHTRKNAERTYYTQDTVEKEREQEEVVVKWQRNLKRQLKLHRSFRIQNFIQWVLDKFYWLAKQAFKYQKKAENNP